MLGSLQRGRLSLETISPLEWTLFDMPNSGRRPEGAILHGADDVLFGLLETLAARDYHFVTPTPETHANVLSRRGYPVAADLRDIFGWSLPFRRDALPPLLFEPLRAAGAVVPDGLLYRSRLRVASLGARLYLHSAYPTVQRNAVFFGPDTYRFVRFIDRELPAIREGDKIVDIGAGSGAGGIEVGLRCPGASVVLTDLNAFALRLARVNARHAGVPVDCWEGPGLEPVPPRPDLVIMNPPFIVDPLGRAYRDGGGAHGAALALSWVREATRRLEPGGHILAYTGSAIIGGQDAFRLCLEASLPADYSLRYEEIDPDIFGEVLNEPGYEDVERLAAVGVVIRREA